MNPVQKQATRVLGGTMTTENQKETSSSKSGWTSFKNYLKSWWPWHISPGKHSATQGAALTAKTRGSSRCCLDVQNGSTGHAGHTKSSPRQCAHSQMLRNSICVCVWVLTISHRQPEKSGVRGNSIFRSLNTVGPLIHTHQTAVLIWNPKSTLFIHLSFNNYWEPST